MSTPQERRLATVALAVVLVLVIGGLALWGINQQSAANQPEAKLGSVMTLEVAPTPTTIVNPANQPGGSVPSVSAPTSVSQQAPLANGAAPVLVPTATAQAVAAAPTSEVILVPTATPQTVAAVPTTDAFNLSSPTGEVSAAAVGGLTQASMPQSPSAQAAVVLPNLPQGQWAVSYTNLAPEHIKAWPWYNLDLGIWKQFPNVDNVVNPNLTYPASQGLEYGMAESSFCQQEELCDIVTPAQHYRIITGDYNIAPLGTCIGSTKDTDGDGEQDTGDGCALMIINVGNVTSSYEDQHVDSGFTVWGRYWWGEYLPQAIWAGMSHVTGNMLNRDTVLNKPTAANAGANCSVPMGCNVVHVRIAVISGNEVLAIATTDVVR